ncbi:hypothetical protein IEO21_01283 [Rhodonia placenta]|uniref:Uncharacterized protein n=1 Tax=Rhodonia placenta TaxID=104341 RepID=A0A8H7P9V1_9APHY|nr:hypothetical protein IEO21_01283 [Postia placenta]
MSELLPSHSARITAVLPVTPLSISSLNAEISSILEHSTYLDQVVLLTPPTLLLQAKQSIRTFLGTWGTSGHVELTVSPWLTGTQDVASLRAARQTTSDFVLFLDDSGLQQTESHIREALLLLEPFSTTVPIGPYGFSDGQSLTCISSSEMPQPATFLIPPFVMPSTLFPSDDLKEETIFGIWRALGESIATPQRDSIGGFVIGPNNVSAPWCRSNKAGSIIETTEGYSFDISLDPTEQSSDQDATNETCDADSDYLRPALGFFLLVFSALTDLHNFSPAACRLQSDGHNVHVLLYDEGLCSPPQTSADTKILVLASCKLEYSVLPVGSEIEVPTSLEEWIQCHSLSADVILTTLSEEERFYLRMRSENGSTVIHIPSSDLPFCDWMGSLTLQEYKSWHLPHVDISVITNDRPRSLSRLLASLSTARYFGDSIDLRVNIEQTADLETLKMVDAFEWTHGRMFLHRRVIHGGLLTAVVESWYPRSNHSYGLILEDDVELSPLFYAWVKLALLRYRYGRRDDVSPRLFGISLYQQKNLELRPEGRHPFNARNTFSAAGLVNPHTPYLSQIPCSWGAVYFPEHWREFHSYLSFRLSEYAWDVDQIVVPGVRSNKWTRSWKKYFIELVYLRGYVMLYPNYADYVSLSTNHLEVGSHVKDVPSEVYLRKKKLFLLPLMQLPEDTAFAGTGLLDLPDARLPQWSDLPSLDLLGLSAGEDELMERGKVRRAELTDCAYAVHIDHDIRDLLCLYDQSSEFV